MFNSVLNLRNIAIIVALLALTIMFSSCKKSIDKQEDIDDSNATIFHEVNQEIPITNEVLIYPNPSIGNVNILVTQNSNVKVLDITGRIIDEFDIRANEIRTVNYAVGMYFIIVENNGNTLIYKIIIKD